MPRSAQRGFTLVETLVAVAILSLAMIPLLAVATDAIKRERQSLRREQVLSVAERAMVETCASLSPGSRTGTIDGVSWTARVEATELLSPSGPAGARTLFSVDVTAHAPSAGDAVELRTLRLSPERRT